MSNHIIHPKMTIIEARTSCNEQLHELSQYTAIDYVEVEKNYGRADGQPVNGLIHRTTSEEITQDELDGRKCSMCPIWEQVGECALRESLQELAARQRNRYELVDNAQNVGKSFRGFHTVQKQYEGSWGGGTPRNPTGSR